MKKLAIALLLNLAVCVSAPVVRAEWDWMSLLGPLKAKQAEMAKEKSVDRLYKLATAREWTVRTSAVLRLGELKSPEALTALVKLYDEASSECVDSPPDVGFFAPAVLGAAGSPESRERLFGIIRELHRDLPIPPDVGTDGYDRWHGALKGLSYYKDPQALKVADDLVSDGAVAMLVREWAAECRLEQELAIRGKATVESKAQWICEQLEEGRNLPKAPYKSVEAIRYRAMQRRLESYALNSGMVEEQLMQRIKANKDAGIKALYNNLVKLSKAMRGDPRLSTPAHRLGRF